MIDPTTSDRDALDDAIDRTVRDMTHAAADDEGVARVMARVRQAGARDTRAAAGYRWMLTPRVVWSGIAALLLMVILGEHSRRPFNRQADTGSVAVTAPPQSSKPPLAAREFPTRVVDAPSTIQATTAARIARRDPLKPASVANVAADPSERRARTARDAQPELPPLESDIVIASITPAPLGDAPAIEVEPLLTTSLTVEAIPVPSIDVPPVVSEPQR